MGSGIARNLAVHIFFFLLVQASDGMWVSPAGLLCCLHTAPCEGNHAKSLEPSQHWETWWPAMILWWQPWTMDDVLSSGASCWGSYPWMKFPTTNYGQEKAWYWKWRRQIPQHIHDIHSSIVRHLLQQRIVVRRQWQIVLLNFVEHFSSSGLILKF